MIIEYTEYRTLQGDTWDFIAWQQYGDPLAMAELIEANPHIPIAPVLPSGVRIAIPQRGDVRPSVTNEQRPPWRQK